MSHEIRQFDKQQGREMAWHGLTDIKPDLSLADNWLRSWDYEAKAVTLEDGSKTPFRVLGVTDTPELFIGDPYTPDSFKPLANSRLLDLLAKATEGKDLILASVGTVKDRGRQFVSFQMGETYKAADRNFTPFFNIGNGNDKSSPIWQNTSNHCTVCNNTFQMNMLTEGLIMEVKKTKFSDLKIGDFGKAARAMLTGQESFVKALETLGLIKCDEATAREFFAGFVGKVQSPLTTRAENIIDRLVTLYKTGNGNDGNDFSDVFQAGTDYFSHESAGGENKWKQFVSSEFGAGNNEKTRLWTVLNKEEQREGLVLIGRDILKRTVEANKVEEVVTA